MSAQSVTVVNIRKTSLTQKLANEWRNQRLRMMITPRLTMKPRLYHPKRPCRKYRGKGMTQVPWRWVSKLNFYWQFLEKQSRWIISWQITSHGWRILTANRMIHSKQVVSFMTNPPEWSTTLWASQPLTRKKWRHTSGLPFQRSTWPL